MNAPAFATNRAGRRFYDLPTGEHLLSVTTALDTYAQYGLTDWSARAAADAAIERADWVAAAARVEPCGNEGSKGACGQCRDCAAHWLAHRHTEIRDTAADLGKRAHAASEHVHLFGRGGPETGDPVVAALVDQWLKWCRTYQVTVIAVESTVVNRTWEYAGTLDFLIEFGEDAALPPEWEHLRGVTVVVDQKTGKSIRRPAAWQVNAYANGENLLLKNGTEVPMPKVGGALIVHNRPGRRIRAREVPLTDSAYACFLSTLALAKSDAEPISAIFGPIIDLPNGAAT